MFEIDFLFLSPDVNKPLYDTGGNPKNASNFKKTLYDSDVFVVLQNNLVIFTLMQLFQRSTSNGTNPSLSRTLSLSSRE